MPNQIPEKLTDLFLYKNNVDLLGIADVTLPDLEAMSETIKGAGIAGEYESITPGHYSNMSLTINWRTIVKSVLELSQPKVHTLDIRGSIQALDAGSGMLKNTALKITVNVTPKKTGLGKLASASPMDSSGEYTVLYIKILLDGTKIVEIDKLNYICYIDGTDFLAEVRKNLGK